MTYAVSVIIICDIMNDFAYGFGRLQWTWHGLIFAHISYTPLKSQEGRIVGTLLDWIIMALSDVSSVNVAVLSQLIGL